MTNVTPFVLSGRELPSWIDGFIQLTASIQSPELFRKWAAIAAIAGALERKVWIRSQGEDLFPNLYIFLVGPPGSGKTRALDACERIWRTLDTHKIAKVSLTKASLMDELAAAARLCHQLPLGKQDFNSLLVASKELGALIPGYDPDFLNALTYLYDCMKYDEKRRGNKEALIIERPQINLIGCCTPSYLGGTMPAGAWDQGFLSRVILIHSDITDVTPLDLLEEGAAHDDALSAALARDMKRIGDRVGRLQFTRPTAEAIEAWNRKGKLLTAPAHPRLINYSTRRIVHVLKLCMVSCVDRGADNIDLVDFQNAVNWLTEAEDKMPDVFKAMTSGGDAAVINDAWHHIATYVVRNDNRGLPLHAFMEFLMQRVPAHSVQKIYEVMLNSKMIRQMSEKGVAVLYANKR